MHYKKVDREEFKNFLENYKGLLCFDFGRFKNWYTWRDLKIGGGSRSILAKMCYNYLGECKFFLVEN